MPKSWIQDRKKEYYYKKAKAEHYRSRATYKLSQAADKYGFIKRGAIIVDLGAAPGGWIQAARKTAGNRCFVLGVDLKPIEPFPQPYVRTIVGDMTDPELANQILDFLPKKADVVISDASQNISGVWEVDHARQIDLANQALEIALKILQPSGNFFVKVFEGDLLDSFVRKVEKHFNNVRVIKPPASRAKSSEMYVLATNLKSPDQTKEQNQSLRTLLRKA